MSDSANGASSSGSSGVGGGSVGTGLGVGVSVAGVVAVGGMRVRVGVGDGVSVGVGDGVSVGVGVRLGVRVGAGDGVLVGTGVGVGVIDGVKEGVRLGTSTRTGISLAIACTLLMAREGCNSARPRRSEGPAKSTKATTTAKPPIINAGRIQSCFRASPQTGQTLNPPLLTVPQWRHLTLRGWRWGLPQCGQTACPL